MDIEFFPPQLKNYFKLKKHYNTSADLHRNIFLNKDLKENKKKFASKSRLIG